MSLIVEFRFRSPDLVLSPTLADEPGVTLTFVTEVATDPDRPYLQFWASGTDMDAFEDALDADTTVAAFQCYTELDDRRLYRVQASEATEVIIYSKWVEVGVTLLESEWYDDWWRCRMRFPDRNALAVVREFCDRQGVAFCLERVFEDDGVQSARSELTDKQRQVLQTAQEMGYFDVPREATMGDVADALDISNQAASERLRRGYRQLVTEHVA